MLVQLQHLTSCRQLSTLVLLKLWPSRGVAEEIEVLIEVLVKLLPANRKFEDIPESSLSGMLRHPMLLK